MPPIMKILLVEDEAKLAQYLCTGLAEEGFVVDVAGNGLDGLHLALEGQYEAIILDRMLPGLDGMAVLAALRSQKSTPVLMLTALGRVEDRVTGLQAGADDYLLKPFAFSELVARLQALVRRSLPAAQTESHGHHHMRLQLADLELDLLRRKAWRAGQSLDLTAQEFTLLSVFLRQAGRVLADLQSGRIDELLATGLHAFLVGFLERVHTLGAHIGHDFLATSDA